MPTGAKFMWTPKRLAFGGSTNAVLHILAICKTANIDFKIDDFQRISDETPFLANC